MKTVLQTRLGQQLTLTPQLRQAIRLLQLSAAELETEINAAIEANPLLEREDEAVPEPGSDTAATDGERQAANDAGTSETPIDAERDGDSESFETAPDFDWDDGHGR